MIKDGHRFKDLERDLTTLGYDRDQIERAMPTFKFAFQYVDLICTLALITIMTETETEIRKGP